LLLLQVVVVASKWTTIDWTKQQPTGANNYQPPCKFLLGGKNVWRGWWFGESAKISRNSLRLAESRGSL
jgi:hypothetical protein